MLIDEYIERLYRGELLLESELKMVCNHLKDTLINESNVLPIQTPVTICGDVHGQFDDVLEIFRVGGQCPDTNYAFLGDFVDRGHDSVETISLLACLKLRYPCRISLLRGNHESRQITQVYGFYAECLQKYGTPVAWQCLTDMFDFLPVAALIDNTILCVHGGLSPSAHHLDQIRATFRFQEVPHEGLIADLLWSDPSVECEGFQTSARGAGYLFGGDVVSQFLWTNSIECIVRAHQLCTDGYQRMFDDQLVTVWSAPNYCYRCGNLACLLELTDSSAPVSDWQFNQFSAVPEELRRKYNASSDDFKDDGDSVPDYFL